MQRVIALFIVLLLSAVYVQAQHNESRATAKVSAVLIPGHVDTPPFTWIYTQSENPVFTISSARQNDPGLTGAETEIWIMRQEPHRNSDIARPLSDDNVFKTRFPAPGTINPGFDKPVIELVYH